MKLKDCVAWPHFCAGAWWLQWLSYTRTEGLTSCGFGEPGFSPQAWLTVNSLSIWLLLCHALYFNSCDSLYGHQCVMLSSSNSLPSVMAVLRHRALAVSGIGLLTRGRAWRKCDTAWQMACNPFSLNLPEHTHIVKAICCLKIILYMKREEQLADIANTEEFMELRCPRPLGTSLIAEEMTCLKAVH